MYFPETSSHRTVGSKPDGTDKIAVFFDKDGTLIKNVPHNTDPRYIIALPGVMEGLQALGSFRFHFIVVTNQPGIARGYFPEHHMAGIKNRLGELFKEAGVSLAGFYYCPHDKNGRVDRYCLDCACRKPLPGLLLQAAEENGIDLGRSWMVGDILDDIEAGIRAGCRTVLINNGNETEWRFSKNRVPHYVARSLHEAASLITTVTRNEQIASGYDHGKFFA